MMGPDGLLILAAVAVLGLILLIARLKVNPFVALLVVSLAMALAAGQRPETVVKAFETGVGDTLGHIALVIALGTMLGKMMAESGGADQIAHTVTTLFGARRARWAMVTIALTVGIPVFFEVGFVLLIPIAYTMARRTGTPLLLVGLPMAAGLSVVHGMVPPHPAALLAVEAYHADIGRTILYALLVGIPTALVAGPIFAVFIGRFVVAPAENELMRQFTQERESRVLPGFGVTLFTILLPVLLMLAGSYAAIALPERNGLREILRFIGSPVVSLLLAVLLSFWTLGSQCGFDRETILRFTNECLGPIAGVVLVVGAGGGFGRMLMACGVSKAIVEWAIRWHTSPLVLAWFVAALVRIATGSATVAMTTASGIMAPLATGPGVRPELMVLATGAGSVILSHVNDGGFWLVKEYFGLTVTETLKAWATCETVIAVVGLLFTLALNAVL